ncbi:MAG: hypothetical protein WC107_03795 [Patescibacteria group bacterium]
MVDDTNTTNIAARPAGQNIVTGATSSSKGLSPWDDDLELPEEKPKIIGTLEGGTSRVAAKPFSLPENIESTSGPKVVQATDFIQPAPPAPQMPQALQEPATVQAKPEISGISDANSSSPVPAQTIPQKATLSSPQPVATKKFVEGSAPDQPTVQDIRPPISTVTTPPVMEMKPLAPIPESSKATEPERTKTNLFSSLRMFGKKEKRAVPAAQTIQTNANPNKEPFNLKVPLTVFTFILIFIALVAATEKGFISIGLEKVYGAVGIEQLWGGLSKNTEQALGRSILSMADHPEFKVKGSLELTIDKTIKSEITTPLVSEKEARQIWTMAPLTQAILAVFETDVYDDNSVSDNSSLYSTDYSFGDTSDPAADDSYYGDYDNSNSNNSSSPTNSNTGLSNTNTPAADLENPYLNESELSPYESIGTETTSKQINIGVQANSSAAGHEATLSVNRAAGSSQISLKNSDNTLWVKSDNILFSNNADPNKWLQYDFAKMQGNKLKDVIFSQTVAKSIVIDGQRVGSEKIGQTLTYKYTISKLEFGDSLEKIGISSDVVQNIQGDVWIGVADKLIRKITLKIGASPSYAVSAMILNLEFSEFDQKNEYIYPDVSSVVKPDGSSLVSEEIIETPSATGSESSVNSNSSTVTVVPTNDETRMSDLAGIKAALENYKIANKKYPIAVENVRLNTLGNAVEKALVPKYISALAKDPNDSSGWYYGYKSINGSSFELSARIEDISDSQAKKVGNVYLYILTN